MKELLHALWEEPVIVSEVDRTFTLSLSGSENETKRVSDVSRVGSFVLEEKKER